MSAIGGTAHAMAMDKAVASTVTWKSSFSSWYFDSLPSLPFTANQNTHSHYRIALNKLNKENGSPFSFEYFAKVRVSPPPQVVSKLYP